MRIVRYIETYADVPEEFLRERWGILVDHLVYAVMDAPYLAVSDDGSYAPEIIGMPTALHNVRLLAPVKPKSPASGATTWSTPPSWVTKCRPNR